MKRITVDTNIFISALFWKGKPDQVVDVFRRKQALLLLSEDILDELERKLNSAKFFDRIEKIGSSAAEVVNAYRDLAEIVPAADVPNAAVRDPKDRMILACAVGGKADFLVSGDTDLLVLETYQTIPILTPSAFLEMLNPPGSAFLDFESTPEA